MTWSASPTFTDGQIVSASGHLGALADNTRWLLGMYRRPQTVWASVRLGEDNWNRVMLPEGDWWQRCYDGYIRNKTDVLAFGVTVVKDTSYACKVRVSAGGGAVSDTQTVAAGSGSATVSGTLDVSGLSGFYQVAVDVQALSGGSGTPQRGTLEVMPLYLEETDAQSYSALAAFTAASTPTAAQWQALSTRDTTLHSQLGGVNAAWMAAALTQQNDTAVWGTDVYRNEYLRYDLRVRMPSLFPAFPETQQYATLVAVVYYNDTVVGARGWDVLDTGTSLPGTVVLKDGAHFYEGQQIKLQTGPVVTLGSKAGSTFMGCTLVGTHWRAPGAGDWVKHFPEQGPGGDVDAEDAVYQGVFALTGLGLIEGTRYQVKVVHYFDGHEYGTNCTGNIRALLLSTQPASNPTLSGWSSMPAFAHGDTVTGAGSVKTIRDNLTWLSSRIVYRNPATARQWAWSEPAWFIQTRRWLHYFCLYNEGLTEEEPTPEIGWMVGREWKTQTLPYEPNRWLKYDLWNLPNLLPGYPYRVTLPGWALEDDLP